MDIDFDIEAFRKMLTWKNIISSIREKGEKYAAEADDFLFYFSFLYDGHVNNILIFEA